MAGFKEQTLFAFKYVLGGQQRAAMMFNEADDLARAMGTKTSTVAESMRELLAGGFSESQSRDITAAIADVAALNPTANVGAISTQLAQMKGAGRVLAEDLKPLLNAGLNDETFYQVLREMKGLGNAPEDQQRLKKMLEQGKVSADQGIQAIMETVNRMGGKKGLGSVAAARATDTVQGQIDNAKAMFERLFMGIQSGPAGSAVGKLAAQVASFLDPKGSERRTPARRVRSNRRRHRAAPRLALQGHARGGVRRSPHCDGDAAPDRPSPSGTGSRPALVRPLPR